MPSKDEVSTAVVMPKSWIVLGIKHVSLIFLLTLSSCAPNDNARAPKAAMPTRRVALPEACTALRRDLKIPDDSVLGQRLKAHDLDGDDRLGVYSVAGHIDINLKEMSFRLLTPPFIADKQHSPWLKGMLWFDDGGELRAKLWD